MAFPPETRNQMFATEWDYRAPTLAEQVEHLRHTWDGPRCPHGEPVGAPGPDLICGHCENDASDEAYLAEIQHDLSRGLPYPFEIGPVRDLKDEQILWGMGSRWPVEPPPVPEDDVPF